MTHQELLNKLAYTPHTDPNGERMHKALRAVVELHQQINGREANCVACFMNTYDCPTIQAIEKELY
jgi:hypothetical protein